MPTTDLILYCHAGDRDKLYDCVDNIVKYHYHNFNSVIIVHQRCEVGDVSNINSKIQCVVINEDDYPILLEEYGIPAEDARADEITHGPTSAHYWKHHTVNHLKGLSVSGADYVVFNDSDCIYVASHPWIEKAIWRLEHNIHLLAVSPSDGHPCETQIMSQQLFISNRRRLASIDWNCWDGEFIEGGPFAQYYVMAKGRVGMYMIDNGLYREVLPDSYRYFHDPEHHKVPHALWVTAKNRLKIDD